MMIDFLIQSDTWGDIVKNLLGMMIKLSIQCDTVDTLLRTYGHDDKVLDPFWHLRRYC